MRNSQNVYFFAIALSALYSNAHVQKSTFRPRRIFGAQRFLTLTKNPLFLTIGKIDT